MNTQEEVKDEHVPQMIEEFMKEEDMTPGQLASLLNVAETTVHRWLRGEARPTGTAASILWTVIGLGGMALGAAGPAIGMLGTTSMAARIVRGASVGAGALTSGVAIYRLLKKRLEREDVSEEVQRALESEIKALEEKERQEGKVKALRERLAEEERKLKEIERMLSGEQASGGAREESDPLRDVPEGRT